MIFSVSTVLLNEVNCPCCENLLILKLLKRNIDGVIFRCFNMSCKKYQSYFYIRIESFFQNFKLSLQVIFAIIYRYSKNENMRTTLEELYLSQLLFWKYNQKKDWFLNPITRMNLWYLLENCILKIDDSIKQHKKKYNEFIFLINKFVALL